MVRDQCLPLFREARSARQAETTQLLQACIGSRKYSVRSASGCATRTHTPSLVLLLKCRITNPMSEQTPVPGSASHSHQSPIDHARLFLPGLPSGQTPVYNSQYHLLSTQDIHRGDPSKQPLKKFSPVLNNFRVSNFPPASLACDHANAAFALILASTEMCIKLPHFQGKYKDHL